MAVAFNEEKALDLSKQIRAHKQAKDWASAAQALAQLKVLYGSAWANTEYAKVLQRAGRFDEAIAEVQWLLAHSRQQWETPGWAHLPESMKEARHQAHCAKVHDVAALICKREKRTDMERLHSEQAVRLHGQNEAGRNQAEQDYQAAYVARGEPFKATMESEEYQLDRKATALKDAGDWAGAIAALRKVKALHGGLYQSTRLAKFLQQAGHLEEALQEIEWLVEHSQHWAKTMFAHQPAAVPQRQRVGWLIRVHGDAILICKRAKRTDLQAEHEQKKAAYASLLEQINPVADAQRTALAKGWEKAKESGRRAMAAFHAARAKRIERNQQ